MIRARIGMFLLLGASSMAMAADDCPDVVMPDDYDEQVQQDFLANYFALASSFSPVHSAIPHEAGRGSIGARVSVLPPLSCQRRLAFNGTKVEDTNKSPILPQIAASYAFPAIKDIVIPYAGLAFLPPVPVGGTRNFVVGAEIGVGIKAHQFVDVGARFHLSHQRTYADIAGAFEEDDPVVEDVFSGSTWGIDAIVGFPVQVDDHTISPFLAGGYVDASTFFFVGDTNHATNNLHPYNGSAFSVGVDTLIKNRLRLGAEFYAAPGGYSLPDPTVSSVEKGSRYGHIFTARVNIGYEF